MATPVEDNNAYTEATPLCKQPGNPPLPLASHELCDLVVMDDLTEDLMLRTLQTRFVNGSIYTSCGESILVAVNPYERVVCDSSAEIARYHRPGSAMLPPHIYQVAAAAARSSPTAPPPPAAAPAEKPIGAL